MRRDSAPPSEAIIIGGGPSGLCLAAALGAEGLTVTCLERTPLTQERKRASDGRTLALSFRSVALLKRAGAWIFMEKDACPILDIRVADQGSPRHLDFHHRDVGDQPFGWIIETQLFHAALQKRVAQMKNVRVIHGAVIKETQRNTTRATVTLTDGSSFTAPLIIAADGRHSLSREDAGIESYGWDYRQTAIVCLIRHTMPHNNVAVEHFQPGGPFATLPMTHQRSSIVWTEKTAAAEALMTMEEAEFTDLLQDKVGGYLGTIALGGKRFSYPLHLQHAQSYTAERLALIGDAAHGIHPIAGQGFNLGMGDIEALTEEVSDALSLGLDIGHPELLRRYEKRRRRDNGNMVLMTDLLDRLFSTAAPPVQAARRFGLGAVQNLPALRRFFMRTAMGIGKKPEQRLVKSR